jgi:hypothetical protein
MRSPTVLLGRSALRNSCGRFDAKSAATRMFAQQRIHCRSLFGGNSSYAINAATRCPGRSTRAGAAWPKTNTTSALAPNLTSRFIFGAF